MINHGWNFDWNDPYVFLSSDKYCKDLPSASYCGFKYPGNGMISYTFPYGGRATLEYGQSWDSGSVHVKKNEVEIDSRNTRGSSTTKFDFVAGDTLAIEELGSVINIHKLTLRRFSPGKSNFESKYYCYLLMLLIIYYSEHLII